MAQIRIFLQKWGIHCFLLPVFFVLHNYKQYYGLVSSAVAIKTLLIILGICLLLFLLMVAIMGDTNKSMQLITLFGFVVLLYGVIKDFLNITLHATFFSKYVVLLPIVLTITIILTIVILRK